MSTQTSASTRSQHLRLGRYSRTTLTRAGVAFAGSLIALSALAGCGSSSTSSKAPTPSVPASSSASTGNSSTGSSSTASGGSSSSAPAEAAMIHIDKFMYTVPASVAPGAKVSVMNMDGEAHTVTSDTSGAFDDMATAGAVTTFTAPTKPGSYPFHCTYHSNMHGVLIVK